MCNIEFIISGSENPYIFLKYGDFGKKRGDVSQNSGYENDNSENANSQNRQIEHFFNNFRNCKCRDIIEYCLPDMRIVA